MLELQTTTQVKIGKKLYDVSYPKVGQILEIENLKLLLSGGTYGELAKSEHKTAVNLLNLIDGVSYFSILIPEFKKDFRVDNFTEMDVVDQKKIIKGFLEFWRWFSDVENKLNNFDEDEEEKTNEVE